jgi:hypothetical protein
MIELDIEHSQVPSVQPRRLRPPQRSRVAGAQKYKYNKKYNTNTYQGRKIPQRGACILYYTYLYCICIVFVFLAPATRDRCGARKRDGASCLGCTLGTWLCSMSNSNIYHVSCYRFVSQHTYIYHIGPHAHEDTDSDSRQQ